MNMKFMRENDASEPHTEDGSEEEEKLQDSSKWKLPAASKLLSLSKNNVVDTVGFGSIEQFKYANKHNGEADKRNLDSERKVFDQTGQKDDTILDINRIKASAEKPQGNSKKRSFHEVSFLMYSI